MDTIHIKKNILLRVRLVMILIFIFSLLVIWKILYIQTTKGEKYRKMGRANNMRYMTLKATRGNIYSDDGNILATSIPSYELAIDPSLDGIEEAFQKKLDTFCILLSRTFPKKKFENYRKNIMDARKEKKTLPQIG